MHCCVAFLLNLVFLLLSALQLLPRSIFTPCIRIWCAQMFRRRDSDSGWILRKLLTLNLACCPLSDAALCAIASSCPALRSISLAACEATATPHLTNAQLGPISPSAISHLGMLHCVRRTVDTLPGTPFVSLRSRVLVTCEQCADALRVRA